MGVWWPQRSRGGEWHWWVTVAACLTADDATYYHSTPHCCLERWTIQYAYIPGSLEPQHTHQFSKDCNAVPWHTCQSDGMVNINLAPTSNASMSSTSRWSSPQRPRKATSALNNRKELPLRNHSQSRRKNWTLDIWVMLTHKILPKNFSSPLNVCNGPFLRKWWQLTTFGARWNDETGRTSMLLEWPWITAGSLWFDHLCWLSYRRSANGAQHMFRSQSIALRMKQNISLSTGGVDGDSCLPSALWPG